VTALLKQMGFIFNADRCVGCKACETACKNENGTQPGISWRRVKQTAENSFLSISCNHCESPECFRVCPERAYAKRKDGIVIIDANLCNGCLDCVNACPYHAPQFDPVRHKVSKCTFCLERQQKGLQPACIAACPTGALQMGDFNELCLAGTVAKIDGFPDILLTRPSIRFYPTKPRKRYFLKDSL
jgi:Fe-S-cluster-containing dehydrogenase component